MERRILIAVFLSFLVLYAYQALFVPPPPPRTSSTPPAASPSASSPPTPESPATPVAAAEPPAVPAAPSVVGETADREIIFDSPTVSATLSNRGGRILHWRLKEYRDDQGQPVDLVPSGIPSDQPTPFSLRVEDEATTRTLNNALYRVIGAVDGRFDPQTGMPLVFEFEDASGLRVRKEFRFDPATYMIRFTASVVANGRDLNPTVQWGPGLGDIGALSSGGSFFTGNYIQPPRAIFHRDGDVERLTIDQLAQQPVHEGQFRFAGVDDHYFLAAAVNPGQARVDYRPVTLPGPGEAQRRLLAQAITFRTSPNDVRFFYGPKQLDLLRSIDSELVWAIDFGIFGWLAVPLLGALQWIYGFVGNYGWAIVLLTVLINLAIFPLRHKSVVSMRKMQEIQPQMKAIQDRYAKYKITDPERQKMNQEVMELYKAKGVNPASGCVPMLLTFPFLFAFYAMLQQAIEIRGADFAGWITNLSAPDPFFITPILMGLAQFWQTKMTPTSADPAQQRIMLFMPIMFTMMSLSFPSGLVIYWLVSTVFTIAQQTFTNRFITPPAKPAAK
jgi:YidC/Oxa1 family membrane protein insertase